MKVVLLSFEFEEYCIRLASALAREAEVLLLLPDGKVAPHLAKLDPAIILQTFRKPRFRQPLRQIRMIATLLKHIKAFAPDVIHFQHGHLWFNLALPWLRHYPLVLTIHNPTHHLGDKLSRKTPQPVLVFGYRCADHVIVHADQLRQEVVDTLRIRDEIIHVIPHIVLGDDLGENQENEDDHRILFFGRIWEYKGLKYLIRAEPLITAEVPQARIVIAGQGEDFAPYRQMMIHPEHFVVHNEYVSHDKRNQLFRQACIVVLPYIEATQSGVIPIAYTFAKPVVATTVGGLPELVEHGRTGYLVPPGDERALADAIVRLLRNKDLRRQLGANGKHKIDTESAPEVVARQTLAVYQRAISRAHSEVSARKPGIKEG
jgi:glycosyltransferase involved in cell wall biosynthesis